jgi:oligopeptidase B
MARKQTTFDDFIACAEKLIAAGRTTPAMLAIEGGSAGGLLMGAVVNQRPELFPRGGRRGAPSSTS